MNKLILSSFACDPTKGSEAGYGWNWAVGLAKRNFEVHCFTRIIGKKNIEDRDIPSNLFFHYVTLPLGLEKLYGLSTPGMYLYYTLWQWFASKQAKKINRFNDVKVVHHVTWGSLQMGSFMYKIGTPFIFGPAGGGQKAPVAFKEYFLDHWAEEKKREKVTELMLRFNPACKRMLSKAYSVLVSNPDTSKMAHDMGAKNIYQCFDTALPDSFFPEKPKVKTLDSERLQLLWTGRLMPRKGALLLLDVMQELKQYKQITLTVVGDGEMKDPFLNKLKAYKLDDTVFWKPKVSYEEIKQYYKDHDAFLFTSLRDSIGSQLLEALAYGMPVITLNLHGQGALINDEIGVRCSVESPQKAIEELKNAILDLYNNPSKFQNMSKAALEFASKQKWEVKIDEIVDQYYPQL